jgi:hypothetical protein
MDFILSVMYLPHNMKDKHKLRNAMLHKNMKTLREESTA